MAFDITPYVRMKPAGVRRLIREGKIDFPTAGMCAGYAQANLVILPPDYAADFEAYTKLNPFPCPVLEIIRGKIRSRTRWPKARTSAPTSRATAFMKTASS